MQEFVEDKKFRYGGFWRRAVAFLMDSIVILVASELISRLFFLEEDIWLSTLFSITVDWLYCSLLESSQTQATLGKLALSLIVTNLQGEAISFPRATGRYFAKYLSILILFIGFIMAAFTKNKQALHDIIAGTLVLRKS